MAKKNPTCVKIGNHLRKRVREKYRSNVEFANVSNVAESTVRRILAGEQNITIKVLQQICEALDIKVSDLFKEIGE
ncbi:MAG: helix-turn-helix domain-containing protein [Bacteroidia bacterium]